MGANGIPDHWNPEKLRYQRFIQGPDIPDTPPGVCRWCLKPLPHTFRRWCLDTCRMEFHVRLSGSHVRYRLIDRDRGVCHDCGIDTLAVAAHIAKEWNDRRVHVTGTYGGYYERPGFYDWLHTEYPGFKPPPAHTWEADHIVPVHAGGGCCGLDNYVTRCLPCHYQKSKEEARKRAEQRKIQEDLAKA